MNNLNIAFFLSNNSKSAKIIIDYLLRYKKNINISLLIFDKKNSGIYENLSKYDIPKQIFTKWKDNRDIVCNEICDLCIKNNIDYIFLSFMKLLSGKIIEIYKNRIVNIHPAILPAFKGINAIERSFHSSTQFMGCTTHFIDYEMDEGITICQGIINKSNESFENHQKRLFFVLCLTLISTIIFVCEKRLTLIQDNKCEYIDAIYDNKYLNPAPSEVDLIINNLNEINNFN